MKKLKLKHLAPYLQHDLMVKAGMTIGDNQLGYNKIREGEVVKLVGLRGKFCYIHSTNFSSVITNVKPILRPLSDLHENSFLHSKSEHPLIEMANIASCNFKKEYKPKISAFAVTEECDVKVVTVNSGSDFDSFEISWSLKNDLNVDRRNDGITMVLNNTDMIHNPYNVYQVLFKHHFDVFGLIGEGLAIDKNTI